MDKFYELDPDTIDLFNKIFNTKSFSIKIHIQFLGSQNQKQLIKIAKLPEQYSFLLNNDIMVLINEDLLSVFDKESTKILMEQEIDKIEPNINTGKIKMVKPDLSTFSGIVSKYGYEAVSRANQVEDLALQQKEDEESLLN